MPDIQWNKRWGEEIRAEINSPQKSYRYGVQWGNPDIETPFYLLQKFFRCTPAPGDLSRVVKNYIKPYINPHTAALEIGPGGGRWTKYLLSAKSIIFVDLNDDFFPHLQTRFKKYQSKFHFYKTSGYEMHGIASASVDFLFSFSTFVHIDPEGIIEYLAESKRVLKQNSIAVIHYADKTKKRAMNKKRFSDMNPSRMEEFVAKVGMKLLIHDQQLLHNSNIAVIQKITT